MEEYSLIADILKGAGVNAPLAYVCWKLYQKLEQVRERERDQLLKDAELFKKALAGGGDDQA